MQSITDQAIADIVQDLPALCTLTETCKALRESRRSIQRRIDAGHLVVMRAAHRGSNRVFVPRASIEAYLRAGMQP